MDYLTVALTAVGLAMDCLAVSLSCGIVMPGFSKRDALRLGLAFGGFQAGMFFIGWAGGTAFASYIEDIDHWVAFGLLAVVGVKMLKDGIDNESECAHLNIRRLKVLVILAVATSIDALAVGISYAMLDISITVPAIMIGLASFGFALAGGLSGSKLGERFGKRMEILGGIILIILGVKILAEHLLA